MRVSRSILLSLLGAAVVLVIAILIRYPQDWSHVRLGLLAILSLLAVAALVAFVSGERRPEAESETRFGVRVGFATGVLWVLEIVFNNFIDPRVSTASARFFVDNGVWGFVALVILLGSLARAFRARRIRSGVRVGYWSGLTGGLIACLMALVLVVVWMPLLLRDPLNIQEYAARRTAPQSPGMATYFAYETLAGALGHLVVLGIVMGLLLGAIGGLLGRFAAKMRSG